MKQTPCQLRKLYRQGRLEVNMDAWIAPPANYGEQRAQSWRRVVRRAVQYLKTTTNSEEMSRKLTGTRNQALTPQAIRQELKRGFAILLERGYLRPAGSSPLSKIPPLDQLRARSSGQQD